MCLTRMHTEPDPQLENPQSKFYYRRARAGLLVECRQNLDRGITLRTPGGGSNSSRAAHVPA